MKVYEVLEKKQINEALPIIGGIGLGGILTAISRCSKNSSKSC